MSQSKNPASNQPTDNTNQRVRCVGGCGFWGDATTKNFCSVCFAKNCPDEAAALKNKKAAPPSNQENDSSPNVNGAAANDSNAPESKEDPAVAAVSNEEEDKKPAKKVQKKKNRCWICRKKMSLAGQFACGCGYTFCAKHRYPDSHDCDIDHKKKHQEHLAKANQVVAFKKVEEI